MIRTKEDVEFYGIHNGYKRVPAVNVKCHKSWQKGYDEFVATEEVAPGFTKEWIEANVSEDALQSAWIAACESAWEYLQEIATEIYGRGVRVYSEGRSGGWAYIDGISLDQYSTDPIESWDAIDLARWRSFSNRAKLEAQDVMRQTVSNIYYSKFEPNVTWTQEIPVA